VSHKQGFRIELAPTQEQAILMGRHAGLSRVVENFCLEIVQKKKAHQEAEKTYGISQDQLTKIPWSAPALEKEWRAAHPERHPWFGEAKLSSRIPKEACRVRATGLKNYFDSKNGMRKGARVGWPKWRKRKHGSRFRYDADRARPLDARTVRLPAIGNVRAREDMSWLTDRMSTGEARRLGATIREQAGRWWIADRWFPSSKTCGDCGRINHALALADRTWACPGCGVVHDRDQNAAGNLLAAFLHDQA
jgi:putative transposase-like DNA-binding protein/helix-turn-helix protein